MRPFYVEIIDFKCDISRKRIYIQTQLVNINQMTFNMY